MSTRVLQMHGLAYCCAGGILVATTLPHLFPSYTKPFYEAAGLTAPRELVGHVRKIAGAMGLRNPGAIQVFMSSGNSSVSGGSTRLPSGALLGLPRGVLYQGPEDVMQSNIVLRGQPVAWQSLEGQTLLKLLPQSANVVNFRIAHEVVHLDKHDWVWNAVLAPTTLVLGYHGTVFLCKTVFAANVHIAFPVLLTLTIFAYAEISTIINQWLEYRADRIAASTSYKYAKGGVEFMRSNIQLDALLMENRSGSFQIAEKLRRLFSSHPPHDGRLQRLEHILALYGQDSNQ